MTPDSPTPARAQPTMPTLLPCPFCGGEPRFGELQGQNFHDWYVTCRNCAACAYHAPSCEAAADAWNRRAERDALAARAATAEQERDELRAREANYLTYGQGGAEYWQAQYIDQLHGMEERAERAGAALAAARQQTKPFVEALEAQQAFYNLLASHPNCSFEEGMCDECVCLAHEAGEQGSFVLARATPAADATRQEE